MTRFKYDIAKNNLSWENHKIRLCDKETSEDNGGYRAPTSRSN